MTGLTLKNNVCLDIKFFVLYLFWTHKNTKYPSIYEFVVIIRSPATHFLNISLFYNSYFAIIPFIIMITLTTLWGLT